MALKMMEGDSVLDCLELELENNNSFFIPREYTDVMGTEFPMNCVSPAVSLPSENTFSVFEEMHSDTNLCNSNLSLCDSTTLGFLEEIVNEELVLSEDTNHCILNEELVLSEDTNHCILNEELILPEDTNPCILNELVLPEDTNHCILNEELIFPEDTNHCILNEELILLEDTSPHILNEELILPEGNNHCILNEELILPEDTNHCILNEELILLEHTNPRTLNEDLILPEDSNHCILNEELILPEDTNHCILNEELILPEHNNHCILNEEHILPGDTNHCILNEELILPEDTNHCVLNEELILPEDTNHCTLNDELLLPEDTNHCILNEELILPEDTNPCILNEELILLEDTNHCILNEELILPEDNHCILNEELILPGDTNHCILNEELILPEDTNHCTLNEELILSEDTNHCILNEELILPEDTNPCILNEELVLPEDNHCILNEELILPEDTNHCILNEELILPEDSNHCTLNEELILPEDTNHCILNEELILPEDTNPCILNEELVLLEDNHHGILNEELILPEDTNHCILNEELILPEDSNHCTLNEEPILPEDTNHCILNEELILPEDTNPCILNEELIFPDDSRILRSLSDVDISEFDDDFFVLPEVLSGSPLLFPSENGDTTLESSFQNSQVSCLENVSCADNSAFFKDCYSEILDSSLLGIDSVLDSDRVLDTVEGLNEISEFSVTESDTLDTLSLLEDDSYSFTSNGLNYPLNEVDNSLFSPLVEEIEPIPILLLEKNAPFEPPVNKKVKALKETSKFVGLSESTNISNPHVEEKTGSYDTNQQEIIKVQEKTGSYDTNQQEIIEVQEKTGSYDTNQQEIIKVQEKTGSYDTNQQEIIKVQEKTGSYDTNQQDIIKVQEKTGSYDTNQQEIIKVQEKTGSYDTNQQEIIKELNGPCQAISGSQTQKLILTESSSNDSVFTCPVCDKPIMRRHNFYKHCRIKHGLIPVITGHLNCPYDCCLYQCKDYTVLRIHLDIEHKIICEEEVWQFSSFEEFGRWKKHMQEIEHSSYVANTSPVTLSTGDKRFYYKCSATQSRSKKIDKKLQPSCPSTVDVTVHYDGIVYVSKWTTHLGHKKAYLHEERVLKTRLTNVKNNCKRRVSKNCKRQITIEGKMKMKTKMMFEATGLENPLSCMVNCGSKEFDVDAEDLKWKLQTLADLLTKTDFNAEIGKELSGCLNRCLEICFNEQKAIGDYIDNEQDLTEILRCNIDYLNELSVNGLDSRDINILQALLVHRGFDHTYI